MASRPDLADRLPAATGLDAATLAQLNVLLALGLALAGVILSARSLYRGTSGRDAEQSQAIS